VLDDALDRSHGDVDVLVRRSELPLRVEQARSLGFALAVYYEPLPGRPLILGGSSAGYDLELGVVDEDPSGFYFVAGDSEGNLQRVDVSADLLSYAPVLVDGAAVHVVSPLGLHQIRAAFQRLGTFGALREKDIVTQERLTRLLEEEGTDVSAPQMRRLTDVEPT